MAKKNQSTAKKKEKSKTVLEEINAKLKSGQKDLQKQVDELTTQVKVLTKDSGKSARKMFKSLEESYHEKVALLHDDFDKRMVTLHKFQDSVIAHLPKELVETLHLKPSSAAEPAVKAKATTKKATSAKSKTATKKATTAKSKTATKKATTVKPKTATKKATTAKPKAAANKATPAKSTKAAASPKVAKATKKPSIASITGIGPVTQKKLAEAGFTSLEDLANTPASKAESLKQFAKTNGFNSWKAEAQALLKNNQKKL